MDHERPGKESLGGAGAANPGYERRRNPGNIRIPGWMFGILISLGLTVLSLVFELGMNYMKLLENEKRIDHIEMRLEQIEGLGPNGVRRNGRQP